MIQSQGTSSLLKITFVLVSIFMIGAYNTPESNSGRDKFIILSATGARDSVHHWNKLLPYSLRAFDVSDAQFAVFVEPESRTVIEVCSYIGPDITRYQYECDVELWCLREQKMIANTILYGSTPARCPWQAPLLQTTIEGSRVHYESLDIWLQNYIK